MAKHVNEFDLTYSMTMDFLNVPEDSPQEDAAVIFAIKKTPEDYEMQAGETQKVALSVANPGSDD
jgi:hypothetical protein